MALFLALDFGGTKLAAGLVDSSAGRMLAHVRRESPPSADESIPTMVAMARECLAAAGERPRAVGISFGGPVSVDRKLVLMSHHVPGWVNRPIVAEFEAALGLPIILENDANAQALGEWRFGAGRGYRDVLYVNVGTGIGGGYILNGRLRRGAHGLAGEVGHVVLDPTGPECTCGNRGCVEAFASGPGIARAGREALEKSPTRGATLRKLAAERGRVIGADVFAAAAAGDDLAREVLDRAITWLGIGIAGAVKLVDPEIVVVGGGVTKAGERLFGPLQRAVDDHIEPLAPGMVPVVPGQLTDDANLFGAAAVAEGETGRT